MATKDELNHISGVLNTFADLTSKDGLRRLYTADERRNLVKQLYGIKERFAALNWCNLSYKQNKDIWHELFAVQYDLKKLSIMVQGDTAEILKIFGALSLAVFEALRDIFFYQSLSKSLTPLVVNLENERAKTSDLLRELRSIKATKHRCDMMCDALQTAATDDEKGVDVESVMKLYYAKMNPTREEKSDGRVEAEKPVCEGDISEVMAWKRFKEMFTEEKYAEAFLSDIGHGTAQQLSKGDVYKIINRYAREKHITRTARENKNGMWRRFSNVGIEMGTRQYFSHRFRE